MKTIDEKAVEILQRSEIVVLSSINKEGFPRPVPMGKIKAEDISVIWMSTALNSEKTKDFQVNPKAGLCFYENGDSIAFTGEVEIITNQTVKEELWQDWFIGHFPGGVNDPNYVLIKFTTNFATLWIDGDFVHKKIA